MNYLLFNKSLVFTGSIVAYFFFSFLSATETSLWEQYDLVGCNHKNSSSELWFQFTSDKDPKCPYQDQDGNTPKRACLSKLFISNNREARFTKYEKCDALPQQVKNLKKNTTMIDLGGVTLNPDGIEGHHQNFIEWKDHFKIQSKKWKFLHQTKGSGFEITWNDGHKTKLKSIFSYFKFPKEADPPSFYAVGGTYLPEFGYVVLVPLYVCEQSGTEEESGVNWWCDGIIILKTESGT